MRVLILSNFFYPEKTGIGVTATDSARYVKELGNEVEVVTTVPYYPEWKVLPEYANKLFVKDEVEGNFTLRTWMYVPRTPSTLKRIVHELSGAVGMFLGGLFLRAEVLFCMSPPLPLGFAAMILAKLKRAQYWCYVLDIQPDAAIELGMLKNPIVRGFSHWMESMMYWGADKVIVLSEGMKANITAKGVPEEKLTLIPNSVDVSELLLEGEPEGIFRKRYQLEGKFLVLYSGNLGVKHNVEIIVHCAEALKERDDIVFAIVGAGAARESVAKLIDQYELKNVSLYPLCERSEFADMLASADLLLAPQRKEVKDIVVPSKLLAYLASKTPVVASAHPESESAKLLEENSTGLVVTPEVRDELVEAIVSIKENPVPARERAERGLSLVRELFDRDVVKEKYYRPLFH